MIYLFKQAFYLYRSLAFTTTGLCVDLQRSTDTVTVASCMLHVSMYHVAAQGYVIICLFKCWVCWSNKSFALSPGRLPSVEGNGTWNVYTVSSSSMLGRRQTNRGWTGDDRVAAPSQRPSKLSIQKWHDATRFDIVSLCRIKLTPFVKSSDICLCALGTTRCLMKTTLMLTAQSTTWTH